MVAAAAHVATCEKHNILIIIKRYCNISNAFRRN